MHSEYLNDVLNIVVTTVFKSATNAEAAKTFFYCPHGNVNKSNSSFKLKRQFK